MADVKCQSDVVEASGFEIIEIDHLNENGVSGNQVDLKDFVPTKILNNNTSKKIVSVLGNFKDKSGVGIVILEKKPFKEDDLGSKGYFSADTKVHTFFQNDIYGNFECYPIPSANGVKTTIIYPATQKHIAKYSKQEVYLVLETPECYKKLTLPHLRTSQFNLQWVYNILEGKSEQERIVFDNPCEFTGFVLLPDLKWDGLTKETLYLLAISRDTLIKSIRDLDERHLFLLYNIRDEGQKAILDKYNVPSSQLRIFIHYQPSFYHLHVHFTYLQYEAPGIYAEKSHLLDTVINNIEIMSTYYLKATLPFVIREMDTLFDIYETNGYVKKIKADVIDK